MKRVLLVAVLAIAGCSQASRTTYDLAVVNVPSADPNHRETQIHFEIPAEAVIQVTAGGDTPGTLFVDRLNSHGTFSVALSVTRNAPSVDGTHSFTTVVQLRSPQGEGPGGLCTYTFKDERSLDDVLAVSARPATVSLGVPHVLGVLDGKPITLLVMHPDRRSDGG
jgi:hypothetical protein